MAIKVTAGTGIFDKLIDHAVYLMGEKQQKTPYFFIIWFLIFFHFSTVQLLSLFNKGFNIKIQFKMYSKLGNIFTVHRRNCTFRTIT